MGELLKNLPSPAGSKIGKRGVEKTLPPGITHKQSHYFQTLANNPDLVEWVKQEAIENDDLPTRTEVLRLVKERDRKNDIEQQRANISEGGLNLPEGLFEIIVIDPPWPYGTQYDPQGRRVENVGACLPG